MVLMGSLVGALFDPLRIEVKILSMAVNSS
jgi:hypothetical protein